MGDDQMTLACEVADPAALAGETAAIATTIRDITKLRGDVRLVTAGTLPNDGKVIEDARSYQ
jgi:phenylacetate-CoA ligase